MRTNASKNILLISFTVLLFAGCSVTRESIEQKMTVRDGFRSAWMETAIFTSETVPMALL